MLPLNYPKVPSVNQLWYSSYNIGFIRLKEIDDINQALFYLQISFNSNNLALALQKHKGIYCYNAGRRGEEYVIFTGLYVEYKGPFSFSYLTDKQGMNLYHQNIVFSDSEHNLWLATSFDRNSNLIKYRKCNGKGRLVEYRIESTFSKRLHYIGHLLTPSYDIFHELFNIDYRCRPDNSPTYITEINDTKITEEQKMKDSNQQFAFHSKEKIQAVEFYAASPEMIALRANELATLFGYKEKVEGTIVHFYKPNKMNGMIEITPDTLQKLFTKEIVEKRNAKVAQFAIENDYLKASSIVYSSSEDT